MFCGMRRIYEPLGRNLRTRGCPVASRGRPVASRARSGSVWERAGSAPGGGAHLTVAIGIPQKTETYKLYLFFFIKKLKKRENMKLKNSFGGMRRTDVSLCRNVRPQGC